MPNSEAIFADLFERQHVFELLDEWARAPNTVELHDLCGGGAFIRQQTQRIIQAIAEVESAHGVVVGTSEQSRLLSELDNKLAFCWTPPRLQANLPRIKELLLYAQDIAKDLRIDRMELHAPRGEKVLIGASRGHEGTHGTDEDKRARWEELQNELEQVMADNRNLSLTGARHRVAKTKGCSYRTVLRHTKDPRR